MRTPDIGTAAREDRTRVDFAALRRARRERVFAEMDRRGLDACLFGREANGRYVAGLRRLWTSNTRPYLPTSVAVRDTRRVHVLSLSSSTEDAPEDVPFEDVYDRSFDPEKLLRIYAALPGLGSARQVGVDGLTVPMRGLLERVCPNAAVVEVEEMMRGLRRVKLAAEIECIRVATAIAESSLQRAADALEPGVTGKLLQAVYLERMCTLGTSTFAQQGTFGPAHPGPAPRLLTTGAPLAAGSLVLLAGGALWAGYEGSLARTWWCGDGDRIPPHARALHDRFRGLMERLLEACRPGRSGADLRRAHEAVGEPLPDRPIAYSVGLGHEGPIAGSALGPDFDAAQGLCAGMVVALRGWVSDERAGFFGEEMVHVTDDAPERLTTMSHGPLGRGPGGSR